TPWTVTPNSNKTIWWQCRKGHEWPAKVGNRSIGGRGCPYCGRKKLHQDNSLEATNPILVKEWHPTKNGDLNPSDVIAGSSRKVWWKCKKGHEWEAALGSRNSGRGCPRCNPATSDMELRVYSELKSIFKNVRHREKIQGVESDIYLPELKFAIEIDGAYWHQDKEKKDIKKTIFFQEQGIFLLRLREGKLKKLSKSDIRYVYGRDDRNPHIIKKLLKVLLSKRDVDGEASRRIQAYLLSGKLANEDEFKKLKADANPLPGKSLAETSPLVVQKWHPTKNGALTPDNFTRGSSKKVWWQCSKGHEWEAAISGQTGAKGCPYCSGKFVCESNCLATVNSQLAEEWHPTKNGDLTPDKVIIGTHRKVWWQCSKGHEWKTAIVGRSKGTGCPECAKSRRVESFRLTKLSSGSFQTINSRLAAEWHPIKNGELTPDKVSVGSDKKVWWQCQKGHEWQAVIHSRSSGSNCPFCSRRRAYKDICLRTTHPELTKQWHPTKNGNLTPDTIIHGSNKKVWWFCEQGHEWEAIVANRSRRQDACPFCSGKKASKDYCLANVNPVLVKEWHPIKNGSMTAYDVTPSSHKRVWWKCEKGHEWSAIISSRNSGVGCPCCAGKKACKDNCLETLNPVLAKEWHSTKNGDLSPKDVTPGSGKIVWWICKNGHEWQAQVSSRNKGNGCPKCAGRL
ncbi:MAG: zinc-ribbon domain-containing protein, partial [Parachlamydiaceae bacterium]